MQRSAWRMISLSLFVAMLTSGCTSDSQDVEAAPNTPSKIEATYITPDTGAVTLHPDLQARFEGERWQLNELEVAILEDYVITAVELNEVFSIFHNCMAEHGTTGVLTIDAGGVGYYMTDESIDSLATKRGGDDGGKQVGRILDTCANKGAVNIGVYWSAQVGNPESLTLDEIFHNCVALAGHPGILHEYDGESEVVNYFWSGDKSAEIREFPIEVQRCIKDPLNAYYEFRQAKQD